MDERRIIARMHEKKISQAEIAGAMRRDRSTICCELQRNFWHDRVVSVAQGYWHVTAHGMAANAPWHRSINRPWERASNHC